MSRRCRGALLVLCMLAPLPCLVIRPATAAELVAALSNHLVAVTTGFSGSSVLLFGAVDTPADVIVVVRGPEGVASVHRRGRSMGIWVNEAGMDFAGAPGFWTIAASRPIDEILAPSVGAFHQIGLENLRLTPMEPTSARRIAEFRAALIRARQREGLFASEAGEIIFLGNRLFRTDLWIPANAPIGTYSVTVFLVREGDVISAETTPLVVGKVGFEARVYQFAHQFGLFYGVAAVLLAAAAGWAGNIIFRKD